MVEQTPLAPKRKAESPSVEYPQDRSYKRIYAGRVANKKALIYKELTAIIDDYSIVLKTRLTAIYNILYSTEINPPSLTSDAIHTLDTLGPLPPSSPVSPVEVVKREKALVLVAEF